MGRKISYACAFGDYEDVMMMWKARVKLAKHLVLDRLGKFSSNVRRSSGFSGVAMMSESSSSSSSNNDNHNHLNVGATSGSSSGGSSSSTSRVLLHRHDTNHSSQLHNSVGKPSAGDGGSFRTSLNDIDDDVLDSPVIGGSFIGGNSLGAINSGDDDHLFVGGGGGSSSSGQNERMRGQNEQPVSKSTIRLVLGIVVLVIVDVIWVASSELSSYLFHDEKFDKPFYSTYIKTSMFLIFLFGFIFWSPWYEQCQKGGDGYAYTLLAAEANCLATNTSIEDTVDDNANEAVLSAPAFVPINYDTAGSGNESDDSAHQRSVRFSKLAEVRHLSDHEAAEAFYSRLSYQASLQAEQIAFRLANRLSPSQTAHLAITFCLMWFVANYTYQLAVSHTQVGIVNVLSSSSSLFTLLMAAVFPSIASDKFSGSKFLSVLVSICGVAVVSLSDLRIETSNLPLGAIFALVSAFFYAAYLVFLRKKVDHEEKLDIPLFFGFVGLFNLLLLWPLFFVLNYTGIESFEWPTKRQWVVLVVNGIIGTVFSEVLFFSSIQINLGCFLTSSLIATLAISLTIPMSMVADVIFKKVSYSWLFYIGSVPVFFSFFAVTMFTHYENWDPVGSFWKRIWKQCWPSSSRSTTRYQRVLVNDMLDHNEQQERLLEDAEEEEDEEQERDEESGFGNENIGINSPA
ncbi:Solute carrier family 35 member F5 [Orchesella cincta]|uniref:Solute carrier family 35 member F5 n=1 Tax=Orchesella cincta TaxID=48709 RepID=A0A1D2NJD1_ORCCI|nr:Solute carrier family 35 member F5 [Orchesella cincta]